MKWAFYFWLSLGESGSNVGVGNAFCKGTLNFTCKMSNCPIIGRLEMLYGISLSETVTSAHYNYTRYTDRVCKEICNGPMNTKWILFVSY